MPDLGVIFEPAGSHDRPLWGTDVEDAPGYSLSPLRGSWDFDGSPVLKSVIGASVFSFPRLSSPRDAALQ